MTGVGIEMEGFEKALPLPVHEIAMGFESVLDGGQNQIDLLDDQPQAPVRMIAIVLPWAAITVDEDAWPRSAEKLIYLATDVAHIQVGHGRVGHIDRSFAAGIDMNIGQGCDGIERAQESGPAPVAIAKPDMRRDDEIEPAVLGNASCYRGSVAAPAS